MPFFSLLCIYAIWKVWQGNKFNWLIVLGISFAFVLQSHYLGLLLLPTLFLFWLLKLKNLKLFRNSLPADKAGDLEIKAFLQKSLIGFIIFAGLMSPLLIFDARHSWKNFAAINKFFSVRQETISIKPWNAIPKIIPLGTKIASSLIGGKDVKAGTYIFWILIVLTFWIVTVGKKNISKRALNAFYFIFVWISISLVGFGLYKQEIYDHYFGFLFTAPFILIGGVSQYLITNAKRGARFFLIISLVALLYVNLKESPLKYEPNRLLLTSEKVAEKIKEEAKGQKFNLAVIAERNYEDGYQYFLEKWNLPVVEIDPQNYSETVSEQLFVVCEMPKEKCDPTHNPKAGIANFGWSKIEGEWEIRGVTLYKLGHTK